MKATIFASKAAKELAKNKAQAKSNWFALVSKCAKSNGKTQPSFEQLSEAGSAQGLFGEDALQKFSQDVETFGKFLDYKRHVDIAQKQIDSHDEEKFAEKIAAARATLAELEIQQKEHTANCYTLAHANNQLIEIQKQSSRLWPEFAESDEDTPEQIQAVEWDANTNTAWLDNEE